MWSFTKLRSNMSLNYFLYFLLFLFLFWPTRFARISYENINSNEIFDNLIKKVARNYSESSNKRIHCDYTDLLEKNVFFHKKPFTTNVFNRTEIRVGGEYWPDKCNARFSTAVIVPYRNRINQLNQFLTYIHNYLRKQNLHYKLFIVEQNDEKPFNRGKLFNIGAKYALQENFPCLVMHDVDLLPLKLGNIYACTTRPRHMSSAIDTFRYNLPYVRLFGGAIAIHSEVFVQANGFSNLFQGWGGEDDDFYNRIVYKNHSIIRFHQSIAQYTMLKHSKQTPNPDRQKLHKKGFLRFDSDGLNSLVFHEVAVEKRSLYTNISVVI